MSLAKHNGKYFAIFPRNNTNYVLEISNESLSDAKEFKVDLVVSKHFSPITDFQLWFVDINRKTIVSKANNFCLSLSINNSLVVKPYDPCNNSQIWRLEGNNCIVNQQDSLYLTFLDELKKIVLKNIEEDPSVCQGWIIDHQPCLYFYIKNKSNPKLVFDVKGVDAKPGAKVILYNNKNILANNQLWYEDEKGVIRSKLNEFVLDATDKAMTLQPYSDTKAQLWTVSGEQIKNSINQFEILQMKPGNVFYPACPVLVERTSQLYNESFACWEFQYIPNQSISLSHSGCGRNFLIQSQTDSRVIEVDENVISEKQTPISLSESIIIKADKCQLKHQFYEDEVSGTIRSVLRNYVFDTTDGLLQLSPFDPYKKLQYWKIEGYKIHNKYDLSLVLQAQDRQIIAANEIDSDKQNWNIIYTPARCFFIYSKCCNKVLDVRGDNDSSGAQLILYEKKPVPCNNQIWYEDEKGILRSKLNGYVLDSSGANIRVMPFDSSNREHHWTIVGNRILNKFDRKMVIDIAGENKWNGSSLIKYKFQGTNNQLWQFEYLN